MNADKPKTTTPLSPTPKDVYPLMPKLTKKGDKSVGERSKRGVSSLKPRTISKPIKTISGSRSTDRSTNKSTNRSIKQPTKLLIGIPINQSIDQSAVIRPAKGFYLTKEIDERLDKAVSKLAKKLEGRISPKEKIDRSTLIKILLQTIDITDNQTIDLLADKLINQLVNRLRSQLTNKP